MAMQTVTLCMAQGRLVAALAGIVVNAQVEQGRRPRQQSGLGSLGLGQRLWGAQRPFEIGRWVRQELR